MPSRYEPTPPPDLRKLRQEKEDGGIDSISIVNWVVVPGLVGVICALIIGRVVPSLGHSVLAGHSFSQMGQNIALTVNRDFDSLTEMNVFSNTFLLLMVFGFVLGIFIKFSFSDARTK